MLWYDMIYYNIMQTGDLPCGSLSFPLQSLPPLHTTGVREEYS